VPDQQAMACPFPHCHGVDVQLPSEFIRCQQSPLAQSIESAFQSMASPNACHYFSAEGLLHSRKTSPVVQFIGDFGLCQSIQQSVNLFNHFGLRLSRLPGAEGQGNVYCPNSATLEADLNDDLFGFGQRNVLDQQTNHSLAILIGSSDITPKPG
jgi:hypothetical protein